MFYKPKFCCNCGEKIERIEWKPWTSRRFCGFCEIEQLAHDMAPKVVAVLTVLFALFGVGGIWHNGSSTLDAAKPKPDRISSSRQLADMSIGNRTASNAAKQHAESTVRTHVGEVSNSTLSTDEANTVSLRSKQLEKRKISSDEPVYHCGAMTKRGTPCSRRLKSRGRCWQHSER